MDTSSFAVIVLSKTNFNFYNKSRNTIVATSNSAPATHGDSFGMVSGGRWP